MYAHSLYFCVHVRECSLYCMLTPMLFYVYGYFLRTLYILDFGFSEFVRYKIYYRWPNHYNMCIYPSV